MTAKRITLGEKQYIPALVPGGIKQGLDSMRPSGDKPQGNGSPGVLRGPQGKAGV